MCGALIAGRRGASAAEFALMLPLLTMMIFGTLQVGMLMYSYNMMVTSARDTVRAMAVCSTTTVEKAKTEASRSRPPWIARTSWVVTPTFGNDVSVRIVTDTAQAMILNYMPFEIGNLETNVTMRREPLAFGGGAC